ncbi:hypothetical protein Acy02nite_00290 [Actinoplanes cyaneus]|uniref:Uncharacterized protein n=1 Tax=Actinoplanes cyaneus TaxID=52696 RepID=A0A919IAN4_9ACTN|nr:hypothetical protein [Actinoplanes cyaneus]GID62148.1 hypothetical protein Acy02nite_00290 [Actinoplanes cyaneus]
MSDSHRTVNRVDLHYPPFPLEFGVQQVKGCWTVQARRVAAAEIADLVARAARQTIVVLDIATTSFLDDDYQQWAPSRIAAHQGVDCAVHDFGALATGVLGLSQEALVIQSDDLPRFLDGWYPYELTLVGLAEPPSSPELDEIGLAVGTADFTRPLLPTLPGCHLFSSGHDDTHLWMESADPGVAAAVLGRQLALQGLAALVEVAMPGPPPASTAEEGTAEEGTAEAITRMELEDKLRTTVADPPGDLVAALLDRSSGWAGQFITASAELVTIGLTALPARRRLGDPLPGGTDLVAIYDVAAASWQFDGSPATG